MGDMARIRVRRSSRHTKYASARRVSRSKASMTLGDLIVPPYFGTLGNLAFLAAHKCWRPGIRTVPAAAPTIHRFHRKVLVLGPLHHVVRWDDADRSVLALSLIYM